MAIRAPDGANKCPSMRSSSEVVVIECTVGQKSVRVIDTWGNMVRVWWIVESPCYNFSHFFLGFLQKMACFKVFQHKVQYVDVWLQNSPDVDLICNVFFLSGSHSCSLPHSGFLTCSLHLWRGNVLPAFAESNFKEEAMPMSVFRDVHFSMHSLGSHWTEFEKGVLKHFFS